jgi:hypothetical protein
MDEDFQLPVSFKGNELLFTARLLHMGYVNKIEVEVNEVSVMYERDDENQWRALVQPADLEKNKSISVELLQAIAQSIEQILK